MLARSELHRKSGDLIDVYRAEMVNASVLERQARAGQSRAEQSR
jgi:hypothetical protein